jgi:ATP-dependent protease ClpP protease subunit
VLSTEDRDKPVIIYVDSLGGSVAESLSIISTMNGIHSPVLTFCRGAVVGVASVITAHGLKGFRTADPTAHFSLRLQSERPDNGRPEAHESYLKMLTQVLAEDTGQPESQVLQWLTQGAEFSAQEAIRNGLIDVISREPLLPKA